MRKIIQSELILYSSSNIFNQISRVVSEIIILNFIPVEQIGIWQLGLLYQSYTSLTGLGIENAMNREYPYSLGKDDKITAVKIIGTARWYNVVNSFLLFFIFLGLGFFFVEKEFYFIVFFSLGSFIFLQTNAKFFESSYRISFEFKKLSWIKIFNSFIVLTSIILPYLFGILGYCIRAIIMEGIRLTLLYFYRPIKEFKPTLNKYTFHNLFQIGWKLIIKTYLNNLTKATPKAIISFFDNVTTLGFFTPVNIISFGFQNLYSSFSSYIYPKMSYLYGKKDSGLNKMSLDFMLKSMFMFLPFVIIGYYLLGYLIPIILPKYSSVTQATQNGLIASYFECTMMTMPLLISQKKWKRLFIFLSSGLFLKFFIVLFFYYFMDEKILGISYGLIIYSILIFLLSVYIIKSLDQ